MPVSSPVFATGFSPSRLGATRPAQPSMHTASEVFMGQSSTKRGQISSKRGQLSPECAERVIAFLRSRHPSKTAEEIEAATHGRVSGATAKKWLSRVSAPSFFACIALISAYGPAFLAAVMDEQPAWLSAAARAERLAELEAEQERIAGEIGRLEGSR